MLKKNISSYWRKRRQWHISFKAFRKKIFTMILNYFNHQTKSNKNIYKERKIEGFISGVLFPLGSQPRRIAATVWIRLKEHPAISCGWVGSCLWGCQLYFGWWWWSIFMCFIVVWHVYYSINVTFHRWK